MSVFAKPFQQSELVGHFLWNERLTNLLHRNLPWLFHACHEKPFRLFHRRNELFLRSSFEVIGSHDGCNIFECVWASIQPWHRTYGHNHFGPITLKMPLSQLNGRRFYVFKRYLRGWKRYYLVQRETTMPLFGVKHRAKKILPTSLFRKTASQKTFDEQPKTQYEIVLTEPVNLRTARFIATEHKRCAMGRCSGKTKDAGLELLNAEVQTELIKLAARFPQFQRSIIKYISEG